jgi:diguanylate cyclase (GGDEF)-like protein/PAS domain S-box-containing protein
MEDKFVNRKPAGWEFPADHRFRALLNSIADGLIALDGKNRVLEWNQGANRIFGYSRNEALGRDLDRLIGGPLKREATRFSARVRRGRQEILDLETVRYAKDGTPVEVSVSASPIPTDNGSIGTVGIYKDISAWKNREGRLKNTSRLLRAIGEINQLIIRASDTDELLRSSCELLRAHGGYRLVRSISLSADGRPVRFFGRGANGRNGGLPPCAVRVLENRRSLFVPNVGKTSCCRSCGSASEGGWAACFLLGHQNWLYGLLLVSNPSFAFDVAPEITFLEETAGNIGFALNGLRERREGDRVAAELRALKEFNENIVHGLAEGIVMENARGRIRFANPTLERLLGYGPGELLGRHWKTIVDPGEIPVIDAKMKSRPMISQERYESVLRTKDGRNVPVLVSARTFQDGAGRHQGVLTAMTDIRELKDVECRLRESQKQLYELATKDGLTGAWNRTTILNFLSEEMAHGARTGQPTSVLMMDVDSFKKINDGYGHLAGDRVLRTMTSCLSKHLRPYDKIGRYGGDEVLLVLRQSGRTRAAAIAERLREHCSRMIIRFQGRRLRFTVSVGCASSEIFSAPTVDKLIRAADRALYRAKKNGRNQTAAAPPTRRSPPRLQSPPGGVRS